MKKRFDIILSLGADCSCAMYMKKNEQRLISSPFDWLTNASFESRIELILNDFQDFINKENLRMMAKPTQFPSDKNNHYYENIKNGLYFWHDFPADIEFDSAYPKIREKYDRRIRRFLEILNSNKNILLVYLSHQEIKDNNLIKNCCNRINKKFGYNISFLIIEHNENLPIGKIEKIDLDKNIDKYELYTRLSVNGVPQTLGQENFINKIFKRYSLENRYYKIKKILVKILCAFVPNQSYRKKIRKIVKIDIGVEDAI